MTTSVDERAAGTDTVLRPFTIETPEADLEDLRARLAATRWPEKETRRRSSRRARSWRRCRRSRAIGQTEYDWRKCEARLNSVPNFITEIDGLDIHFIHVRSKHEDALPLIVTHGWPGSVDRAAEDHRSAHRPHGTRRERIGRVPRGDPVDARLRLLRQADRARAGTRTTSRVPGWC